MIRITVTAAAAAGRDDSDRGCASAGSESRSAGLVMSDSVSNFEESAEAYAGAAPRRRPCQGHWQVAASGRPALGAARAPGCRRA